jgi:hypothetical protein
VCSFFCGFFSVPCGAAGVRDGDARHCGGRGRGKKEDGDKGDRGKGRGWEDKVRKRIEWSVTNTAGVLQDDTRVTTNIRYALCR